MRKVPLFILLIICTSADARLINFENQHIQSDSIRRVTLIDLLYNYQNNNEEELSQINSSLTPQHKSKNYLLILGNIDYPSVYGDELSNSRLIHYRYNRKSNIYSKSQFVNSVNVGFDTYAPINVCNRNINISNGLKLNI